MSGSRPYGPPTGMPQTTSGISVDPRTLERVIAPTKRKDGSARKELKVRPGFTPEEDKVRYRSTGVRDAARLKGYIPGATNMSSNTYKAPDLNNKDEFPGLSASAKKRLKKKQKAEQEKGDDDGWGGLGEEEGEGEGEEDEDGGEQSVPAQAAATGSISRPSQSTTPNPDDDPNFDSKQAIRHLLEQVQLSNPAPTPPCQKTPPPPAKQIVIPPKKDPKPGGLFGAALKAGVRDGGNGAEGRGAGSASARKEVEGKNTVEGGADLPAAGGQGGQSTPGKKEPRPGGGLLGAAIRTSSSNSIPGSSLSTKSPQSGNNASTTSSSAQPPSAPSPASQPRQNPPKPKTTPTPTTGNANTPSSNNNSTKSNGPRQRPEVRVRPGHGLAGMMKQIAEQNKK